MTDELGFHKQCTRPPLFHRQLRWPRPPILKIVRLQETVHCVLPPTTSQRNAKNILIYNNILHKHRQDLKAIVFTDHKNKREVIKLIKKPARELYIYGRFSRV